VFCSGWLIASSQVVIYSVGLVDANEEEDPDVLRRLSKDTGGIAFFPTSLESVADISKRIARDLREQYTLGFVPEKTDTTNSFRQVRVKVAVPGHGKLHVRTRPGYFTSEQGQASAKPGKSAS
jgi:Ca-activated chloride channel family protein